MLIFSFGTFEFQISLEFLHRSVAFFIVLFYLFIYYFIMVTIPFISSISLVKMVYKIAEKLNREPAWKDIERAIRRNFGGLDEIDPVEIFRDYFSLGNMVGMNSQYLTGCFLCCLALACLSCNVDLLEKRNA